MQNTLSALTVPSLDLLTFEQIKAAFARNEPIPFADPFLACADLSLQKTFYPYGFPLEVSTNSEEVLAIAEECWHGFQQLFDVAPIRFHIGVTAGGSGECPPPPTSRVRQHLCAHIGDGENYRISDSLDAFSLIWLTETTLGYRNYVRYFILDSTAMYHVCARNSIGIHAACVELDGNGILLCGDSGAGKTTLSYACASTGWTYITDDASFLITGREDSLIVGNSRQLRFRPSAESLFPELQGRPVLERAETGKPSVELTTAPLPHVATAFSSQIKHLVFLNRNRCLAPELVPLPAPIARAFILQPGIGDLDVAHLRRAAVDRLLNRGVFELRYSDLDQAVERLERLVREGC